MSMRNLVSDYNRLRIDKALVLTTTTTTKTKTKTTFVALRGPFDQEKGQ